MKTGLESTQRQYGVYYQIAWERKMEIAVKYEKISFVTKYEPKARLLGSASSVLMFMFAFGLPTNSFGAGLSVLSYGAVGDGLTDDTAAIQKASDACLPGSTVSFPAGNYRIAQPILAHSGCSYIGSAGAILTGYTGTGPSGFPIFRTDATSSDITFSGLTMNGGGVNLAGAGWANHITFTGNTVENIVNAAPNWGPHIASIYCSGWGMQNTTITGNTFQNQFQGGNNNHLEPDDPETALDGNGVSSLCASQLNPAEYIITGHLRRWPDGWNTPVTTGCCWRAGEPLYGAAVLKHAAADVAFGERAGKGLILTGEAGEEGWRRERCLCNWSKKADSSGFGVIGNGSIGRNGIPNQGKSLLSTAPKEADRVYFAVLGG